VHVLAADDAVGVRKNASKVLRATVTTQQLRMHTQKATTQGAQAAGDATCASRSLCLMCCANWIKRSIASTKSLSQLKFCDFSTMNATSSSRSTCSTRVTRRL
jgi:hypothetical protein